MSKLVLSGYTARPPHKGIAKVALGAENWFPWESVKNPGPWLRRMKRKGYAIVALEQTKKAKNIFRYRPKWPVVLIVGNELKGISPALLKLADTHVDIPMRGEKESLNVASAMAVAVYAMLEA